MIMNRYMNEQTIKVIADESIIRSLCNGFFDDDDDEITRFYNICQVSLIS